MVHFSQSTMLYCRVISTKHTEFIGCISQLHPVCPCKFIGWRSQLHPVCPCKFIGCRSQLHPVCPCKFIGCRSQLHPVCPCKCIGCRSQLHPVCPCKFIGDSTLSNSSLTVSGSRLSRLNCLRRWGWQTIEIPQNNILKDKRLSCSILPEITEVRELQHMKTIRYSV